MFDNKSRYYPQQTYQVTDRRGRIVVVTSVPQAPDQLLAGYHLLKQGQRIDHLADLYNGNAAGFWAIDEINDVMLSETLTEQIEIAIPQ